MKKSNIITKIMLALVMACLAFALVACGGGGSDTPKKPTGGGGKTPKPVEKTFTEYLGDIADSVDALLAEAKGIENGTAYLSLGLGVTYKNTDSETEKVSQGAYKLAVDGNVRKDNPELSIAFTAPNGDQANYEWFRLALSNYALYLKQPLTAVNNDRKTVDAIKFDEAGLKDAADDLMDVALDFIDGLVQSKTVQDLSLKAMLLGSEEDKDEDEEEGGGLLDTFGGILEIKETKTGWEGTANESLWGTLKGVVGGVAVIGGPIQDFITNLTANGAPTLKLTVDKTNNVISDIKIGYYFDNGDFGELAINLKLSKSTAITLKTLGSEYKTDALHANVTATAAQKNLKAAIDAYVNANLTKESGNYVGYATLIASDANGQNAQTAYGIVKDGLAAFDLAPVFTKLDAEPANSTNYKANIQSAEEVKANGNLQSIGKMTFPTIVEFFKNAAADAKDYYFNTYKKGGNQQQSTNKEQGGEKGLMVNVYEWLGGDISKLEPSEKTGEWKYLDPTEQEMMKALNAKIGNYVNFEIDTSNPTGKGANAKYSNYINTIKNLAELVGDNDTWLIGFDLIDSDKMMENVKTLDDIAKFEKYIANFAANTEWSDWAEETFGELGEGYHKFGIVDWDTENYRGGMVVYAEGENNDLLDAINVFVKFKHEGEPDGQGNPTYTYSALTVSDIAGWLNDNICKGAKYFGVTTDGKTNTQITKEIVTKAIGYQMVGEGDDIVTELIMNGLYVEIGSAPNAGIYGFIAINDVTLEGEGAAIAKKGATEYAKLEGSINFVTNTVEADAKAQEANLIKETTVSLNAQVAEDGTVATEDVLNGAGEKIGIKVVYPNAEECFGMLYELWEAYVAYGSAK